MRQVRRGAVLMTRDDFRALVIRADHEMKATNGHSYLSDAHSRCKNCLQGRVYAHKRCVRWFDTYMEIMEGLLIKEGVIE